MNIMTLDEWVREALGGNIGKRLKIGQLNLKEGYH